MEMFISSLVEYVEAILTNSTKTNEMIFRGQASSEFDLISSIGRIENYSIGIEKKLFREFKKKYFQYASHYPNTDLELLIMAQHYGLPTRLLDWTFNPLIALFFACESHLDIDGKVYSIPLKTSYGIEELGDLSLSIDKLLLAEKCKYIVPPYTEARYSNQKSLFLLCNLPYKRFTFADNETTYIIKKEAKEQIIKDLVLLGIERTFVYPLLENVSKDILERFNIKMKSH